MLNIADALEFFKEIIDQIKEVFAIKADPKSTPSSKPVKQDTWYRLSIEQIASKLSVDTGKGLSAIEAQSRLQKYGPNVLASKKKESGLSSFPASISGLYADHSDCRRIN